MIDYLKKNLLKILNFLHIFVKKIVLQTELKSLADQKCSADQTLGITALTE